MYTLMVSYLYPMMSINMLIYVIVSGFTLAKGCKYFLFNSTISGAGKGIIAGEYYSSDSIVEESITVLLDQSYSAGWQTNYYTYASENENFSMLVFGVAMLYNHHSQLSNMIHYWSDNDVLDVTKEFSSFSNYTKVRYWTSKSIEPGEELFTSYGDHWFDSRDIILYSTPSKSEISSRIDINTLYDFGFCLSDVFVDKSNILLAGRGLFAGRSYTEGDIVTLSPAVILPKNEVFQVTSNTVFQNYLIADPSCDFPVVLLPLGVCVAINHESSLVSNVKIVLNFRSELLGSDVLDKPLNEMTPLELSKLPFAPVDLIFVATRSILPNEEITLNYGVEWIHAWSRFLAQVVERNSLDSDSLSLHEDPLFRHPIMIPNLFPSSWCPKFSCENSACSA